MNKRKIALIFNIIILIFEVIGFGYTLVNSHHIAVEYYTNDSNLLALFVSLLYIVFYKKDYEFIKHLRFVATCCLTITLIVVLTILGPMMEYNYKMLLFENTFLIFHTICPIISIISYLFYEDASTKPYLGFIATLIYGIIIIILNLANVLIGPYQFLRVKEQAVLTTIMWGIIIIGGSYVIGLILNYLNQKLKGATV